MQEDSLVSSLINPTPECAVIKRYVRSAPTPPPSAETLRSALHLPDLSSLEEFYLSIEANTFLEHIIGNIIFLCCCHLFTCTYIIICLCIFLIYAGVHWTRIAGNRNEWRHLGNTSNTRTRNHQYHPATIDVQQGQAVNQWGVSCINTYWTTMHAK